MDMNTFFQFVTGLLLVIILLSILASFVRRAVLSIPYIRESWVGIQWLLQRIPWRFLRKPIILLPILGIVVGLWLSRMFASPTTPVRPVTADRGVRPLGDTVHNWLYIEPEPDVLDSLHVDGNYHIWSGTLSGTIGPGRWRLLHVVPPHSNRQYTISGLDRWEEIYLASGVVFDECPEDLEDVPRSHFTTLERVSNGALSSDVTRWWKNDTSEPGVLYVFSPEGEKVIEGRSPIQRDETVYEVTLSDRDSFSFMVPESGWSNIWILPIRDDHGLSMHGGEYVAAEGMTDQQLVDYWFGVYLSQGMSTDESNLAAREATAHDLVTRPFGHIPYQAIVVHWGDSVETITHTWGKDAGQLPKGMRVHVGLNIPDGTPVSKPARVIVGFCR